MTSYDFELPNNSRFLTLSPKIFLIDIFANFNTFWSASAFQLVQRCLCKAIKRLFHSIQNKVKLLEQVCVLFSRRLGLHKLNSNYTRRGKIPTQIRIRQNRASAAPWSHVVACWDTKSWWIRRWSDHYPPKWTPKRVYNFLLKKLQSLH